MLGRDHCHITVLYKEGEELFGTLHIEEWAHWRGPRRYQNWHGETLWHKPLGRRKEGNVYKEIMKVRSLLRMAGAVIEMG